MDMKKLKMPRVFAMLLVAVMLLNIVLINPGDVSAAAPASYTDIVVGQTPGVNISSSGGVKYFRFIPDASGSYTFSSSNYTGDPKAYLLDANGTQLTYSDDASGMNFAITWDMVAGETYYLKACMYGSRTGSYTLNLVCNSLVVTPPAADVLQTQEGYNTYSLFNSGATSYDGYEYSTASGRDYNPDCRSYDNSGYDIYGNSGNADLSLGIGLSFVVNAEVTERATLTIYAYDIDEESSQIDEIYLVNDATGARTRLGALSGRNEAWSTTTLTIDPSNFVVGQTYHFEVDVCGGGWWTWVRRASLEMTCGEYVPTTIVNHVFSASINSSGYVSTNLYLQTSQDASYNLEYTATINAQQKGGKENSTIYATAAGVSATDGFYLESGSPTGTYEIGVILKDAQGNTVASYTTTAGYAYSAVNYDSNGGSNNLPTDTNAYSSGNTVTVLFDYLPSRAGYTFLGWARTADATQAEFTSDGTRSFTIGSTDVTLYAVWQENAPEIPDVPISPVDPPVDSGDADVWDGSIATAFGGGNGSQNNPYLIYTAAQLAYLAQSTNNGTVYEDQYFKLMNDLDLNNLEWTPIGKGVLTNDFGSIAPYFSGHFDGNFHVIYNLRISNGATSYNGLFGNVYNGSLTKLGVVNAYVYGNSTAGRRLNNGALAGSVNHGQVSLCFAVNADVYAYSSEQPANAAVLLGNLGYTATVSNCFAQGTATSNASVAGLIGSCYNTSNIFVYDCYAVANVTFDTSKGESSTAIDEVGGLCGWSTDTWSAHRFENCFFAGGITSAGGAEVSTLVNNTTFGCFYDVDYDYMTNFVGTATSRSNFKSEDWIRASMGWDFYNVWTFVAGEDYPVLQGFAIGGGNGGNVHVHTPGDWIVDVEPTCTTSGSKHTECTTCGYVLENIYISPLNHNYVSVVTKEATCTEPGIITSTCIHCGDSYLTYIYSQHNYVVTDRQEATCTVEGYITYTCTNCDDRYNEVIQGGHNYIAEITRVATATTDGVITYTCEICGDSYVEVIPARPDAKVLLIQDRLPWSENNNVTLLNKMQSDGYITGWDMVTTSGFDAAILAGYGVVLVANDQTTATYNQLLNLQDALVDFANAGGVVVYGACDQGWSGGYIGYTLPGGAEKNNYYSNYNYIVDPSHPIVTGMYTDGKALGNTALYSTYCSHSSFSNLPADANVILQDGRGNPTLVEYALGNGAVILSGLTWEYSYNRTNITSFSKTIYDDLIMYALQLSDPCDHAYDAGEVVEPTCDEQGYLLHTCALCGATMKDTFVDANGHVEGEWVVVTPATSTATGLKTISCTVCGEVLDQEVLPMLYAPVISVTMEADTVILGQTFDAYIVISDMDPVKSVAFVPVYDTELFELVSVQWLKQATIQVTTPEIASAWSMATNVNGELVKLTFRAKALTTGSRITSEAYVQNNGVVQVSVVGDSIAVVDCTHEAILTQIVDDGYHANVCTICGFSVVSAHSFDHACDETCNECDYTRDIMHILGEMEYDDVQHWAPCVVCGERQQIEDHEFEHGCDTTCAYCDYTRAITHVPGVMEYDDDQHWISCTVCGDYLDIQDHVFDYGCDRFCNVCAYQREASHNTNGAWYTNEHEHWLVCYECGLPVDIDCHEYVDDTDCVCNVCGYQRAIRGDVDGDGDVDSDDAIHLLMSTYFPDNYALNQSGDMDGNGVVNSDDSIYLLMYTYFPDRYPLYVTEEV